MIRFVIGLPGGGKTMFCVSKIIEELVYTERFIVTNIEELKLGRLNEYLQEKYPDRVIDLHERLLVIPKPHTFFFYRYRSGGLILPEVPTLSAQSKKNGAPEKIGREEFLDYMVSYFQPLNERAEWRVPVSYFISEAHEYFSATEWMDIGRAVTYCASKHRHLHDEWVLETQAPENVAATFRRLAAQYHRITNHYTMSFGPFKNRGCFERKAYYSLPKDGSVAYESVEFRLDAKGVASCYETTGATGVMNRGPEAKGFGRSRKLPWWCVWLAGAGALVGIIFAVSLIPKFVSMGIGQVLKGTTAGVSKAAVVAPGSQSERAVQPAAGPVAALEAAAVTVRAAIVGRSGFTLYLSDGTRITDRDGLVESFDEQAQQVALRDGRRLRITGLATTGF